MPEIEERHFDRADEFIAALRRSDPYWLPAGNWQVQWIFRGQRCADRQHILPAAWRPDILSHELYQGINDSNVDWDVEQLMSDRRFEAFRLSEHADRARQLVVQKRFEFSVARGFADLVDDLGLPVPGGPVPNQVSYDVEPWPGSSAAFHPTVALAQHHRMPTRLLDWTHNPLIAAFFAAERAVPDTDGRIAVWAAHRPRLLAHDYREFTVQRSQIGFLYSQEGLFTYAPMGDFVFLQTGNWPCLEDSMPYGLRKLTLRNCEAPRLLRLLWAERISKAHLMPTLDNVTHALQSVWREALKREIEKDKQ